MARSKSKPEEPSYPLRAAARLTGLSPEVLRAWERRHGVVVPMRTPGGSRRYSAADIERLRLVKSVVDAGHRIGEVGSMDEAELKRRSAADETASGFLGEILGHLYRLDAAESHRLLALQLSTLGPARFAREAALPLVQEIGERWSRGELGIAQEHLASSVLRSLLGASLQPTATSLRGPRIVFATPTGEPHELGLLMAALSALGAGANPLYLGAEVPTGGLPATIEQTEASVLALGIVTLPQQEAQRVVDELRDALTPPVQLWLGGSGAGRIERRPGVEQIASLEELEQRVLLLGFGGTRPR